MTCCSVNRLQVVLWCYAGFFVCLLILNTGTNRKHILRCCPTNCNFSANYWCFLIEFLVLLKTRKSSASILTNNIITRTLTLMTIYLHGFRFKGFNGQFHTIIFVVLKSQQWGWVILNLYFRFTVNYPESKGLFCTVPRVSSFDGLSLTRE